MLDIPSEFVNLLKFITPGLTFAWIYFSFTAHALPSQFERLIHALIWTFIIQAFVWLEKHGLTFAGTKYSFGEWTDNSQFIASIITAILPGFFTAYVASGDHFYKFIRKTGLSSRSIYPNNLHAAFSENKKTWVTLQLHDGTRLLCYVIRWPLNPQTDHYVIERVLRSYAGEVGEEDLESSIKAMVISAAEVKFIEFIRDPVESTSPEVESASIANNVPASQGSLA